MCLTSSLVSFDANLWKIQRQENHVTKRPMKYFVSRIDFKMKYNENFNIQTSYSLKSHI